MLVTVFIYVFKCLRKDDIIGIELIDLRNKGNTNMADK